MMFREVGIPMANRAIVRRCAGAHVFAVAFAGAGAKGWKPVSSCLNGK